MEEHIGDIEFCDDGTVKIETKDYISEAIEQFGEDVSKNVSFPVNLKLNNVDNESPLPLLNTQQKKNFHSIVTKLLWVMKHGRPDIDTTIVFLCTCVAKPTVQD